MLARRRSVRAWALRGGARSVLGRQYRRGWMAAGRRSEDESAKGARGAYGGIAGSGSCLEKLRRSEGMRRESRGGAGLAGGVSHGAAMREA